MEQPKTVSRAERKLRTSLAAKFRAASIDNTTLHQERTLLKKRLQRLRRQRIWLELQARLDKI